MQTLLKLMAPVAIGFVAAALGVLAGSVIVAYVFPPPATLHDGMRELTPVQILAFGGTFAIVGSGSFVVGLHLWDGGRRR